MKDVTQTVMRFRVQTTTRRFGEREQTAVGGMRTKIGLTFGMLTLVLLLIAGFAVSNLVSGRIEADTSAAVLRAARLVAFSFNREIQERQRDLQALAALLGEQQALDAPDTSVAPYRTLLKDFSERYGLEAVTLIAPDGLVRVASEPALEGVERGSRPWFKPAQQGPQVTDQHAAGDPGRTPASITLAVPVKGLGGTGVLATDLSNPWVDRLRERLSMLVPPEQQAVLEVLVLSADGRVLTAHNAPGAVPADAQALAPGSCARGASTGKADRYVTCAVTSEPYKDFAGLGWRVVIRLPERVAFATAENLESRIATIGLVAALFFGIIGWLLADRISDPIKAMARAADRIASGERDLELPIGGRDETAQLGRSLSSLLTRLRQDEVTLVRANQALEAAVAERTLELEKAVAELQEANTDLDRFASMVSHDLLAPVRAMRTFSELLQMDFGETMAPEAQRLLKRIDQAGLDMSNLVNGLHALSKLGKKPLHVTATDMTLLVRQCIQAHLPAWDESRITLSPLEPCQCDPVMMRIVFDNLIGNAVKYSNRQPDPRIVIAGERQGEQQVYWVADNGAGFDPQYAHRLFQIFQRLHSARDYPGTGVGLATVAKIVSRHGGRVWAEGIPGEGATFYIALPILHEPEAAGDVWPESTFEPPGAIPPSA